MRKRLIGYVCMVLVALVSRAVPAWHTPQTVVQPDGSRITLTLQGDEWLHYYAKDDGTPVFKNEQGYYVPYSPFQLAMMKQRQRARMQRSYRNNQSSPNTLSPLDCLKAPLRQGEQFSQRVLVILAQFNDVKFTSKDPNATFTQHLNAENYKSYGYGSARDYFVAQSNGLFTPYFDVYGPYTAEKEMKYYGENNEDGYDKHAGDLVAEVLKQGNKDINFKDYDADNDGVVDFCYVIYSGYGEAQGASENTIWPHQWTLADATGAALKLDGVQVNAYACSNELHGTSGTKLDGIGTICHEFGHCLGLPDWYDTSDEGTNIGMSVWSIMDYGCYNEGGNTPAGYTAYEKEFLGWLDIETIDTEQELTLRTTADGGKAYRIVSNESTDEYFLMENIQKEGWNRGAYGHGLLITHVDYKESAWKENTVNNGEIRRMTIVPADGSLTKTVRSWAGDPYPGTSGNTEFSDYSSPASLTNRNLALSKPITDIREVNGIVKCSFMKGCGELTTALNAESVTPYSFTARWSERAGTTEYVVEFYRISGSWPSDKSLWTTTLFTEQGELIQTVTTASLKASISNLEADKLYCYRVRCRTNGVLSDYSNLIFVLTSMDNGTLAAPVMHNPAILGDSCFRLSWSPVAGASYIVEYEQAISTQTAAPVPDGSRLVSEHFDRVTAKCGEITRVLDMYTDTTDWRGTDVYAQDGCVLLGTENTNGFLMTPVLPRTEGMVTIEFSVRRYSADDKQPLFHICLATDANRTVYIDQIGGYVPDEEFKNYYCVLGPLDTGSTITFISNSERSSGDTPRVCFDNLSIYWGDRNEDYSAANRRISGIQEFGRPVYCTEALSSNGKPEKASEAYRSKKDITTSSRKYIETPDTFLVLSDMESGNYICRVRAVKNEVCSPYSDAHSALVGASAFEVDGLCFEVISLDHNTVQLMPLTDGRHYTGDIVVPEAITFEGTTYTVTALADSVFRGCTKLTSVVVPSTVTFAGSKLFKGCQELGWVDWQCEAAIDSTDFIGTAANTLVYVNGNTEVMSDDIILVRDGEARNVTVYINSPFLVPRSFTARRIRYQKDFSQKNVVGRSSGWETIVLPFDVQRVEHETKGALTPFGVSGSDRHFWLGRYNGTDFTYTDAIKANIPCVIAFPNSTDYRDSDCLNGVITFSAENATVQPTLDVPPVTGTSFNFVPVYKKVYKDAGRYMLNVYDESKTPLPGSEFQRGVMSIRTFGAYMQVIGRTADPERLPIRFDGEESPPPFPLEEENIIYAPDGRLIPSGKILQPQSIHIVNGKKYYVK